MYSVGTTFSWSDSIGSLEAGKLADFIVLDRDLLTCPEDDIKETRVLRTYIDGKLVYEAKPSRDRSRAEGMEFPLPLSCLRFST